MMDMVEQEIIRFHDFFVEWMTGALSQTDANFAQFSDSLSTDFYIVNSSGKLTRRDALIEWLYQTHNQRPNLHIWIVNVQVHHTIGDVIVATYEEWSKINGEEQSTALLSTVVFSMDKSKPNHLLWQCVHETSL